MNCPYCGAPETTGGTVHGEGCWQAPKRSTVAVSRLPDAEKIAEKLEVKLREMTWDGPGHLMEDWATIRERFARVLREEGVAE